jgi:hypothetical protein
MELRLDAHSKIDCASCDHETTTTACSLGGTPGSAINACASFREPSACKPPLPVKVEQATRAGDAAL